MKPIKIAVLGGGSFGTVLANISAREGSEVYQWMRDANQAETINSKHRNPKYVPELSLPPGLIATTDLAKALHSAKLIILAIPSKYFKEVLDKIMPYIDDSKYFVSATKGIAPDRFCLMSDIIAEALRKRDITNPEQYIGVLSGPNLANEIADKHFTGSVIASKNQELSRLVHDSFSNKYMLVFENSDVYGVELAGALKNIYAIASGISDSLGFGINTKSLLITRSTAEIVRFAIRLGANPLTFLGLAGLGDLIATCSSIQSRNYKLGAQIVDKKPIEEITRNLGGVAEGIHTTKMTYLKARELNISMPLLEAVYRIIFEKGKVKNVLWKVLRDTPSTDVEQPAFKN